MIQIGNNSIRSKEGKTKGNHQRHETEMDKRWHCKQWLYAFIADNGGGHNARLAVRRHNYDDDQEHEVPLSWFLSQDLLPQDQVDVVFAAVGEERMRDYKHFFNEAMEICRKFRFSHNCQLPETNRELQSFLEFFRDAKNAQPPPRPPSQAEPGVGSADPGLPRASAAT